jgi:hypothetical protein
MRASLAALATAGVAAVVAAVPAAAVDDAKPAPCTAYLVTDKAGDSVVTPFGVLPEHAGPANSDITGLFLNYRAGKDGKKVLTANIEIAKLDMTIPSPQDSTGGLAYYAIYTSEGKVRFVRAHNQTGTAVTYGFGTIDPDTGTYTTDGTTQGAFFEGDKGIVQIDVPEAAGGKLGAKLGGVFASVDGFYGGPDDASGFNNPFDTAPNDGNALAPNGKPYTVAECGAGGTPTTPTTPPPAGPDQPPTQPPSGTQELPLTVPSNLGSAKKAAKKKTLAFKATASKPITNLRIALQNSKKTIVGRAAIARLEGTKTLKLKFAKKPKKGTYTLVASGTVDGGQANKTLKVKIKK